MKFILGKKIRMSQIFDENDKVIPVTLIDAGPCYVTQVKTEEKDGYSSVQIGLKEKKINIPIKHNKVIFKKSGIGNNLRYLREFFDEGLKIGDKIDVGIFNPGEIVRVSGISKGKGFQGVVKRHGFSGAKATHGTKHNERAPGSIGSAWPQRVFKGKRMAGRMGSDRITVEGLEIVGIDKEENLLVIRGALPGRKGTLLEIITTKEIEKAKEEEKEKTEKQISETEIKAFFCRT